MMSVFCSNTLIICAPEAKISKFFQKLRIMPLVLASCTLYSEFEKKMVENVIIFVLIIILCVQVYYHRIPVLITRGVFL